MKFTDYLCCGIALASLAYVVLGGRTTINYSSNAQVREAYLDGFRAGARVQLRENSPQCGCGCSPLPQRRSIALPAEPCQPACPGCRCRPPVVPAPVKPLPELESDEAATTPEEPDDE